MDEALRRLTTPDAILRAALVKEKQAFDFYSGLLSHSKVAMVQDLVTLLKDEELRHVRLVERKIAELNMGRG